MVALTWEFLASQGSSWLKPWYTALVLSQRLDQHVSWITVLHTVCLPCTWISALHNIGSSDLVYWPIPTAFTEHILTRLTSITLCLVTTTGLFQNKNKSLSTSPMPNTKYNWQDISLWALGRSVMIVVLYVSILNQTLQHTQNKDHSQIRLVEQTPTPPPPQQKNPMLNWSTNFHLLHWL